jgi:hypothetical protein
MKTYKNFRELYAGWQAGDVPFCVLQEMTIAQLGMIDIIVPQGIAPSVSQIEAILKDSTEPQEFMYELGGDVHICENEEDLKQIESVDFEWARQHNDKWPNATDQGMSWDCCDYVLSSRSTGWVIFLLCTNNAGGHTYYVPEALWPAARVLEHTRSSDTPWEHASA